MTTTDTLRVIYLWFRRWFRLIVLRYLGVGWVIGLVVPFEIWGVMDWWWWTYRGRLYLATDDCRPEGDSIIFSTVISPISWLWEGGQPFGGSELPTTIESNGARRQIRLESNGGWVARRQIRRTLSDYEDWFASREGIDEGMRVVSVDPLIVDCGVWEPSLQAALAKELRVRTSNAREWLERALNGCQLEVQERQGVASFVYDGPANGVSEDVYESGTRIGSFLLWFSDDFTMASASFLTGDLSGMVVVVLRAISSGHASMAEPPS